MKRAIWNMLAILFFAGAALALDADASWSHDNSRYSEAHRLEEDIGSSGPSGQDGPLSTCKTIATGLGMSIDGATLFCPNNGAWEHFAKGLGYKGSDAVLNLLSNIPINTLKEVLGYHVIPNMVLPAASFRSGQTILGTLAGSAVTVAKIPDGHLKLVFENSNPAQARHRGEARLVNHDEAVERADLTFEGVYVPGAHYVVHQIEDVLVPPVALDELKEIRAKNKVGGRRLLA